MNRRDFIRRAFGAAGAAVVVAATPTLAAALVQGPVHYEIRCYWAGAIVCAAPGYAMKLERLEV